MIEQTRRTFSAAFKLESAQLVVDQGYGIRQAAEAMEAGKSIMEGLHLNESERWFLNDYKTVAKFT